METIKSNDPLLSAGLFDLQEFCGWPVMAVNKYFKDKGWEVADCFNDYKRAWVNRSLDKTIIAKTEMIDDEALGNEIISTIMFYDGIYSE